MCLRTRATFLSGLFLRSVVRFVSSSVSVVRMLPFIKSSPKLCPSNLNSFVRRYMSVAYVCHLCVRVVSWKSPPLPMNSCSQSGHWKDGGREIERERKRERKRERERKERETECGKGRIFDIRLKRLFALNQPHPGGRHTMPELDIKLSRFDRVFRPNVRGIRKRWGQG